MPYGIYENIPHDKKYQGHSGGTSRPHGSMDLPPLHTYSSAGQATWQLMHAPVKNSIRDLHHTPADKLHHKQATHLSTTHCTASVHPQHQAHACQASSANGMQHNAGHRRDASQRKGHHVSSQVYNDSATTQHRTLQAQNP